MERKLSRKELKGKGTELMATMHVGKGGVSEGVVEELVNQLKANKLVKVKVLASSSEQKREMAEELAARSGAVLVEVRGNTILLCDRRYME